MFTQETIKNWLINYLAQLTEVPAREIDTKATFSEYGLESGIAMGLVGDFEKWLNVELPIDVLFDHPSVEALTIYVSQHFDSFAKSE